MEDLDTIFKDVPYHTDIKFEKSNMPVLPSCFKPTVLGSYRIGMEAQYRCGLLHAYEFPTYWLIHKDEVNPEEDAVGHLVKDAPRKFIFVLFVGALAFSRVLGKYLKKN
jgi:hypothetical protein